MNALIPLPQPRTCEKCQGAAICHSTWMGMKAIRICRHCNGTGQRRRVVVVMGEVMVWLDSSTPPGANEVILPLDYYEDSCGKVSGYSVTIRTQADVDGQLGRLREVELCHSCEPVKARAIPFTPCNKCPLRVVIIDPEEPRCAKCGYTRRDMGIHMDHHLCAGDGPFTAEPLAIDWQRWRDVVDWVISTKSVSFETARGWDGPVWGLFPNAVHELPERLR